jgi:hypothetical protein
MRQPTPEDYPTAQQDAGIRKGFVRSMNGHLTMRAAIPPAVADKIGYDLNVLGSTVRKWCREPETDEEMGSGRRSPLDRAADLITAVFRSDNELGPPGARRIVRHLVAHLDDLESEANEKRESVGTHELEEIVRRAEMDLARVKAQLGTQQHEKLQAVK